MAREGDRFWSGIIFVSLLIIVGWIVEVKGDMVGCLNFVFYLVAGFLMVKIMVILERIEDNSEKINGKHFKKHKHHRRVDCKNKILKNKH